MAELSLKQITDKLNTEFTGSVRKLVFWYDTNGEFVEDVDTMALENAKVYHLEQDNQFYTKYFLECVDTTTNYLVYAPFAKPDIRDNHLADTIRYSKEFFADRASLLTLDLGIDERYKPVVQHYIKFFGSKARTQAFYDLELENFNRTTIEVALMSVLCKCKIPSLEEVLRTVLLEGSFEDNIYLASFASYDLLEPFWQQISDTFGYADASPTLEKLAMSMFVTYGGKVVTADLPASWQSFVSGKSGNVVAFLDNLMNSLIYGDKFDAISAAVYKSLKGQEEFAKLPVESLISCSIFAGIDDILIRWMTERLEMDDVGAKLKGVTIPELTKKRCHEHFGCNRKNEYLVLENAWNIISGAKYQDVGCLNDLVKKYTESLYLMDSWYRNFYYHLDKLEDAEPFSNLKELVENIYANDYLANICANWTDLFAAEVNSLQIPKQVDFYNRNVQYAKEQLVVIISDGLRYEVAMSLLEMLQADEKCNATMSVMASTLPSITEYGMAALLPHKKLELTEDYSVLVDGQKAATTEQRQAVLQKAKAASRCVQYDEIKGLNIADLRSIFTRQEVVYVYHNQIDARGDKAATENEVFNACQEALEEIAALIRRLTVSANRSHFIITADHGFLYRRKKIAESDKNGSMAGTGGVVARRYALSEKELAVESVTSLELNTMMNNGDTRRVTTPIGADIFKVQGAGINYVHGGLSPQEMIVPLIEVKTEKSFKETKPAQIALAGSFSKITNLITSMDFVQTEPVSDVVKETTYRIYFIDDNGEKISNEHLYVADKKEVDTAKRVFRLRFSFKNQQYSTMRRYYLVAIDDGNSLEALRHEVQIDMPFVTDDFGFF